MQGLLGIYLVNLYTVCPLRFLTSLNFKLFCLPILGIKRFRLFMTTTQSSPPRFKCLKGVMINSYSIARLPILAGMFETIKSKVWSRIRSIPILPKTVAFKTLFF